MAFMRLLVAAAAAWPVLLAAQTGPITIRFAPAANQTLRMRMVQETAMDVEPADGSPIAIPAMKLGLTMRLATIIAVGGADPDGRVEARMTYDDFTLETTLNG
jgi:hypothetical protein